MLSGHGFVFVFAKMVQCCKWTPNGRKKLNSPRTRGMPGGELCVTWQLRLPENYVIDVRVTGVLLRFGTTALRLVLLPWRIFQSGRKRWVYHRTCRTVHQDKRVYFQNVNHLKYSIRLVSPTKHNVVILIFYMPFLQVPLGSKPGPKNWMLMKYPCMLSRYIQESYM